MTKFENMYMSLEIARTPKGKYSIWVHVDPTFKNLDQEDIMIQKSIYPHLAELSYEIQSFINKHFPNKINKELLNSGNISLIDNQFNIINSKTMKNFKLNDLKRTRKEGR